MTERCQIRFCRGELEMINSRRFDIVREGDYVIEAYKCKDCNRRYEIITDQGVRGPLKRKP